MSDGRVPHSGPAPRRRFAATLAALAITAGAASVWAQPAPAAAAPLTPAPANANARNAARGQALPKPSSPRQMAEEIIPMLQRQKTPWQLFAGYEQAFSDFAAQEKALAPANNPNDLHAKRAEQLRAMAALLASMGQQAKTQDDIKHGSSTVPPEKRQSAFTDAGKELARLLAEFVRQAAALPQVSAAARP